MSHSSFAVRLIANLTTFAGIALLTGWSVDYAAGWLGYRPMLFCILLHPVIVVAYEIGVFVTCIGVIMWVVSFGKSESGLALAIGGFLLFALPLVLPRYLGVVCPS